MTNSVCVAVKHHRQYHDSWNCNYPDQDPYSFQPNGIYRDDAEFAPDRVSRTVQQQVCSGVPNRVGETMAYFCDTVKSNMPWTPWWMLP